MISAFRVALIGNLLFLLIIDAGPGAKPGRKCGGW